MKKLVLLSSLCACATVPMARRDLDDRAKDAQAPDGAASLYVYRPESVFGVAVTLEVFLDEAWVGDLASGTFTEIVARPGEHKLVVRARGKAETTLIVERGRSYFVKAKPAWGLRGANASVEVVADERAARDDLRRCHLVAGVAAQAIRDIAAGIASVSVDPVQPDALVAVAGRAVGELGGAAEPWDLEAIIARVRATNPAIDDGQIVSVAARAMVASLRRKPVQDPRSLPSVVDRGCGLVVTRKGPGVVVERVVPDSPAAVAQVEAGSELREVNGQSTRDRAPSEVAQLLAGAPGSEVVLALAKPGGADQKVVLRRAPALELDAVDCRVLDGRVLYLRPWELQPAAARRVRDAARAAGAAAQLVVLDLRDNPGGSVEGARDLADSFLTEGDIISVAQARIPDVDRTYGATPGTSVLEQARTVVLVNEKTSGTAEAAAAALQDHLRATLLGSHTAGDARLSFTHRFRGVALSVPTARLVRASGKPLDLHGVEPDAIEAPSGSAATEAPADVACPNILS